LYICTNSELIEEAINCSQKSPFRDLGLNLNKMGKRVLIIGAGGVGNVVVRKCASVPEVFSHIMLASRTKSKCDAIAADIKNHEN
jgi:shikimate 5-dehydrogenase